MSSSVLKLNIIPDTEVINTFSEESRITPNENYVISGRVEIELTRPIQIRQLIVEFRGRVECIISASDYFQETVPETPYRDEIPLKKWTTINSNEMGLMNRIVRKAVGQAMSYLTISHEHLVLLDEPQLLGIGKRSWPFSLKINNVHLLPPSILTPHQVIQYVLSARIKLNSFSERFKVSYWNACMNTLRINHRRKILNENSSLPMIVVSQQSRDNSIMEDTNVINYYFRNNKRHLLSVSNMIRICRHSYPSLHSLYSISRIRYRGCRQGHISYEIGMSKFTCLQRKVFPFVCTFNTLCADAVMDTLEYYLEQIEVYPIRAGDFNVMSKSFPDCMIPRRRKLSYTKHDMREYRNGEELKFTLSLDLPHIAPQIQTGILQISHKLRLTIKFKDRAKERDMSLSFALNIGTIPEPHSSSNRTVNIAHARQELDQWLIAPDQHHSPPYFEEEFNKLPSYHDVIMEGNPPSPFLEDHF
ncbi:MAG: hypothetical protein EXX96DRAFT_553733 [Benjaminiella poitrasii]|nr:MAG: hypothetical protein EXX96DRAFT_553733 [Benjaminiella poitrasii]